MTPKQRLLAAIQRKVPDRLPVTTHHVMTYFLNKYMNGATNEQFFDHFGLDPITWTLPLKADKSQGQYMVNESIICTDKWRHEQEPVPNQEYKTIRYRFATPKGTLTNTLQFNEITNWQLDHPIKNKSDIDLIAEFAPEIHLDVEAVNKTAEQVGENSLVRAFVMCFEMFGQPGCWQDACCMYGTEKLIMATFDDLSWVHQFLKIIQKRKIDFIRSTKGAKYDILELGGGDASTTIISPQLFNEFVAPYDSEVIKEAHKAGQRIVYHTCGGMMPILEDIAAMGTDAMETFTPPDMGGDTNLAEAKRRIGDKVCMIGGFDQFHYLKDCTEQETRNAVRKCFEEAGANGGFILSPSDHFFDVDMNLLKAFADEARNCVY